jgi:hypothetical protein
MIEVVVALPYAQVVTSQCVSVAFVTRLQTIPMTLEQKANQLQVQLVQCLIAVIL